MNSCLAGPTSQVITANNSAVVVNGGTLYGSSQCIGGSCTFTLNVVFPPSITYFVTGSNFVLQGTMTMGYDPIVHCSALHAFI